MAIFYFFRLLRHRIFHRTLQDTMQHAACSFDPFNIPWILQKLLFLHTSFWQEDFLNICNPWMTHLLTLGLLFQFHGQLALKFHTGQMCCFFWPFWHTKYIEIIRTVMPKPIFLMTVQEAHKGYNSLTDQIQAKYEQLDSGEYRAVGTQHLMLKPWIG